MLTFFLHLNSMCMHIGHVAGKQKSNTWYTNEHWLYYENCTDGAKTDRVIHECHAIYKTWKTQLSLLKQLCLIIRPLQIDCSRRLVRPFGNRLVVRS